MMTDCGHHGEGDHDEPDVAMPAAPRTRFILVEPEFVFGRCPIRIWRPVMLEKKPSTALRHKAGVRVKWKVQRG
jgi:hypothetical protein